MGSSHQIVIGVDHILGTDANFNISDSFIHCINSRGIFFWHQVISKWQGRCPIWKRARELGLDGNMAPEWDLD